MTFAPDSMKVSIEGEQQPKPVEIKKLSQEEKMERVQTKREMIQEEFEAAQEQLDEVEAALEALGTDGDPSEQAKLKEEMEMIQSTMDSIEQDLAGLNSPEEVVPLVDNKAVEKGAEATPSETVVEAPMVASAVEAPQEKTEEELRFEAAKAQFLEGVDTILGKMPDLNEAGSLQEADGKVAAPLKELTDLLGNVRSGEKATLVLREIAGRIGQSIFEYVKQMETMLNKPGNKVDKYGRKKEVFNLKSVRELAGLGRLLDDADPKFGAECSKYVLDQYVEKMAGKSPEETRKKLFDADDNRALYSAFESVVKRLGRGEKLPEELKGTVKQLLPILEASDKVNPEKPGYAEASRFLTDDFLVRHQDIQGSGQEYSENKKMHLENVRRALKEISA